MDSTHGTVYYATACDGSYADYYYSNRSAIHAADTYDSDGFCINCGAYEPVKQNSEGIYKIITAGQLFWFASLVNGDTTQAGITAADTSANAVLVRDITIPSGYEWTPIGTKAAPYTGTFDGDGYTVSGMSIKSASTYMGLFGYVSAGTIKNLTVSGAINVSGNSLYAGGIVGTVSNGTLSNLTSNVNVTAYDGKKGTFGGVAATVENGSTMELCVNNGTVTASGVLDCVGGLVGYMNSATITNSINYGTVDTTGGTAKASTSDNTGIYTGGIIGYINNAAAFVTNCVNLGTIKGAGENTDDTCYNGAVVGRVRSNLGGITNVFYLDTSADAAYGENESGAELGITAQTAAEFATGAATWNLQNANTDDVWGQTIGTDAYPQLTSEASKKVILISFCKSTNGNVFFESYTNPGGTLSSYPTGDEYTFYSDSALTQEISDISTLVFDADTIIYVVTAHDLTIVESNGGTITEDTDYTYENHLLTVLTGGEYTISGTSKTDTIKVDTSDDVTITLAGVNITSAYGSEKSPFEIADGGNVTVKLKGENTLTSESSGNAGLQLTNANLVITSADGDGEITGSLEATGDSTYSAGIGSGYRKDFGSIIINGGTITATGSTFGSGIGGASRGSGSITINGGNVSASSKAGAGIGSGNGGSYNVITITGGTIDASSNNGAAIGGGQASEGTITVNISGGYITASTNNSEADYIGSGYLSTSTDTVNITGGYFGSGSVTDETVYDVTVASGYSVLNNNDTVTQGTYPVYVGLAYTVEQSLTNVTSSNTDTKVSVGGSYSTTLKGTDCYVLPGSISVTAGGTELTADTDYTYNSSSGELTIESAAGNIVITAAAASTSHSYNEGEVTQAATCTENGVMTYTCTVCGDTYTEVIPATGHTTEIQNAKDATCTEDGYTGDEVCTVCGETVTAGEVIPATGHTTEIQNAKDATCTEDGYTGDEVCTVCGETVTTGEVIPATGHSLTYTASENTITESCANGCGHSATAAIAEPSSLVYDGNPKATSVSYSDEWKGDKPTVEYLDSSGIAIDADSVVNVGTYTAQITVGGATANVEITISPLPIELTWDYTSFVYDGDVKTVAATVTNAVSNDSVPLTYSGNTATDVGDYTAEVSAVSNTNYTLTGATGLSHSWSIVQSATDGDVKTYNSETQTSAYTYGDTITVKATLEATGTASGFTLSAFTPLSTATAAIFNGETQISDAVAVTNGAETTLTVDTTDLGASDSAYTLTLKYYGDNNMAATTVDFNVTIGKATPAYTVPTGLTAVYGDTLASVTLPDNWTWDDNTLSVGNVGENEFVATFTPSDKTNYETVTENVTVTVSKATPTYTVPTGLTAVYGDTLASVTLPDGWTWDDDTQSVGNVGDNEFAATFTPSDKTNYETVTENVTVTVAKADQAAPDNLSVTQPDEQTSTGTITGVTTAMEYSIDGGSTWEEITGDTLTLSPCTVLIRYAETANYNAGATVEITISASNPSYTIPTDLTATYGDTLADVTLPTATNGTWTWEDEDLSVGNAGTNTFTAIFTPNDGNHNTVYVDVTVTVAKAMPTYTVPTGLTAVYGDTLASVTLPTGWIWANATTSVGNVGENEFAATFTPDDKTNYETVTENVIVTVAPLPIEVEWDYTSFVYDGSEKTVSAKVTNAIGDDEVNLTCIDNSATEVGSYEAAIMAVDNDNYTLTGGTGLTNEWTIEQSAADGSVKTYNGETETSAFTYGDTITVKAKFDATGTAASGFTLSSLALGTAAVFNGDVQISNAATVTEGDEITLTVDSTDLGAGNYTLTLKYCGDYNIAATALDFDITIAKAEPTVTLPTGLTAVYGDTLASVTLPSGWAWVDATASVGDAGTHEFEAVYTPADVDNYNTVTAELTVTVEKAEQSAPSGLTVTQPAEQGLTGTIAGVTTDMEYSTDGSTWTAVTGDPLTVDEGTVYIRYAENGNYNAGEAVEIVIASTVPTYEVPTGLTAVYGDTLKDVTLPDADNGVWTWEDDELSVGSVGDNKFTAIFTPTDSKYDTVTVEVTVTVEKAEPSYEVPTGLTAVYGDTLADVTLPNGWAWDNENLSVGEVGENEFAATYTPSDDNYNTVTANISVTVTKAEPEYTVPTGLTAVYGDKLSDVTLPDGWTWEDEDLSVGNAGTNTFTAIFTPGDDNYNTVTIEVSVTVEKAEPSYEVPTGLTAVYGDTLASVALPDNWTWADAKASVGGAGDNTFAAIYTPEDVANYNTATEILTVTVEKAEQGAPSGFTVTQPDEETSTGTITGVTTDMEYSLDGGDTWEEITDDTLTLDPGTVLIRYAETENYNAGAAVEITIDAANPSYTTPTDLTATYGDTLADVTLPDADNGTWTWENENMSVGNAGTNTFTAIFTPNDDNHNTVTVEVTVTVAKAEPSYEVPTDLTATYGDILATVTLPTGWTWADAAQSVGDAGTNTFTAIFTPEDSVNYETVTAEIDVEVGKATPTYELPTGLTANYGDTLADVALPDGWTWADATQSVGDVGANTFTAVFTPDDTENYNTITAEITVTVSAVTLTVTEAPTAARVKRGNTLSKSTLSGGSVTLADGTEISGTWAWADGTETMSKSGTYERTAVFTADDEVYGTVEAAVNVTVYTSGSGGGGSSSGTTVYTVTAEEPENGDISFDNSTAKSGATVTITVTPDEGFETESITVTDASGNEIELTQTGDDTYTFVMPPSEVSISAEFTEIETETEPTTEPTDDDTHICLSEKFTDVDTALWYHEYIDYVLENGLMNGTGGTTFEPNTATTRAMIVTILYRLEGEPKTSGTAAFTDVAAGSWYADAVAWAAENGIVLGYGDGTFGANDVITREQTAAILYRYANYKGADTSVGEDTNILSYTDAGEISEYAIPAMQWAVGTGLVNGKGNNTLDPQGGATRAETAAMLMRFIEAE